MPALNTRPPQPEPTETTQPATDSPIATTTAEDTPLSSPIQTEAIIVDHTAVALFDQIPEEYLSKAAALHMIYIDRSVGDNINDALNCLTNPSQEQAPNHCKRTQHPATEFSVDPAVINWNHANGYGRENWQFSTWDGTDCSEWSDKIRCFIEMMAPVIDQYNVVSYQLSYLAVTDGSDISDPTVGYFSDNPDSYDVHDQEAYEAQYPDKTFIYWTTSLSRSIGTEVSDDFNDQMRAYALNNNKVLFDVANILAHDPNGQPCYDNRDGIPYDNGNKSENYDDDGQNYLAICQHYTTEVDGGHLGSVSAGKIQVAKAFWVLMARIAGWDGASN